MHTKLKREAKIEYAVYGRVESLFRLFFFLSLFTEMKVFEDAEKRKRCQTRCHPDGGERERHVWKRFSQVENLASTKLIDYEYVCGLRGKRACAQTQQNKYTKSFTASVCLMLGCCCCCCCRWKWVLPRSTSSAHIEEIKQTKGMACSTHIARSTKPKGIFGVIPDGCSGHVVNWKQLKVAKMQERWRRRCAAYTFIIHQIHEIKISKRMSGCLSSLLSGPTHFVRHSWVPSCAAMSLKRRRVIQAGAFLHLHTVAIGGDAGGWVECDINWIQLTDSVHFN